MSAKENSCASVKDRVPQLETHRLLGLFHDCCMPRGQVFIDYVQEPKKPHNWANSVSYPTRSEESRTLLSHTPVLEFVLWAVLWLAVASMGCAEFTDLQADRGQCDQEACQGRSISAFSVSHEQSLASNGVDMVCMRDVLAQCVFHSLPIPLHLKRYLCDVTRVTFRKTRTVGSILCPSKVKMSIDELCKKAQEPCHCAAMAERPGIPFVNGHCVLRCTDLLHKTFGPRAQCVILNMTNDVLPSWESVHTGIVSSLRKICSQIVPSDICCDPLYSECLSVAKRWWGMQSLMVPWYMREGALREFTREHSDWCFLQCDKNTGRPMAMCPKLCAPCLVNNYTDESQFETLMVHDSHMRPRNMPCSF